MFLLTHTRTPEVHYQPLTKLLQERVEVRLAIVADPAAPAAPVLCEAGGEHAWPVGQQVFAEELAVGDFCLDVGQKVRGLQWGTWLMVQLHQVAACT